jgi:hypothetical protein
MSPAYAQRKEEFDQVLGPNLGQGEGQAFGG